MMKIKAIVCLFVVMLLFTSCSTSGFKDENNDEDIYSGEIVLDDEVASKLDIKRVSHQFDRKTFTLNAETSFGLYEYIARYNIPERDSLVYLHSANITFTDYHTAKTIYLCNVPGCMHNNAECTSYIEYSRGLWMIPDYWEKHIIIISMGTTDRSITSDKELAAIYVMDLDGSNRREVIRLEAMEEISIEDSLFVDNEDNLYFIVLRASQKELRRLDLSSGKCETLLTTGMGMVCRHSYDDNIVLEYYDKPISEMWQSYCVSTKGTAAIRTELDGYYLCMESFSHYYIGYKCEDINDPNLSSVELGVFDYRTDKIVRKIRGIPCVPGHYCDIYVFDNNKIEWSFLDDDEVVHEYIVDLNSGECSENKLTYLKYGNDPFPVPVIAESGDSHLLVMVGNKDSTLTLFDYQGVPHVFDVENYQQFALISVDDYCNGVPNYHPIENSIFVTKS